MPDVLRVKRECGDPVFKVDRRDLLFDVEELSRRQIADQKRRGRLRRLVEEIEQAVIGAEFELVGAPGPGELINGLNLPRTARPGESELDCGDGRAIAGVGDVDGAVLRRIARGKQKV